MNRRSLLAGLSGLAVAGLAPDFAHANQDRHPLERLKDIDTGLDFALESKRFNLVVVMTAQESYADCGSIFAGVHMIMNEPGLRESVRPVMIMPRVADQSAGASDLRNLARAQDMDITVLSGPLDDVKAALSALDGAFLEYDSSGKVNGHTQNAYFLTPSSKLLLTHPAADNITLTPLVGQIVGRCMGGLNPRCW